VGRIADAPSLVSSVAYFIPSELDAARAAITTLKTSSESAFRSAHRSGLDAVFGAIARPKLRQLVGDVYRDVAYALGEDTYAEAEYADAVRKRFTRHWDALTSLPRSSMTDGTYLAFFGLAVNALVRPWEAHIRGLRFTELGALRYDRDLRGVLGHLSGQTPLATGTLRDAFARLQQIGTLLNLDSADDADELAASPGWKLSAADSKAVVALRLDL
jgi:conserved oligomeric Golgi complex subunit 4